MEELKISNRHERVFMDAMFSLAPLQEKKLDEPGAFKNFLASFNHKGLELWENLHQEIDNNCLSLPKVDKISYLKRLYDDVFRLHEDWLLSISKEATEGETLMPYKDGAIHKYYALPNAWLNRYFKNCMFRVVSMLVLVQKVLRSEGVSKKEVMRFVNGEEPEADGIEENNSNCRKTFKAAYNFNELIPIMPQTKAIAFEIIETSLLEKEYLDENRKWNDRKEQLDLVALIHLLDDYDYFKAKRTSEANIRLNKAKRLFIHRYGCNITNQFKPAKKEKSLNFRKAFLETVLPFRNQS